MSMEYLIRPVMATDSRAVWQISNEATLRHWAYNSAAIDWETHQNWMKLQLESHHPFWVVEDEDSLVAGYVRFAPDKTEKVLIMRRNLHTVSIGLGLSLRGKGLGAEILGKVCDEFFFQNEDRILLAWVKCDNIASLIIFLKAGFKPRFLEPVHGVNSMGLVKLVEN